jgi:hypothetical protein
VWVADPVALQYKKKQSHFTTGGFLLFNLLIAKLFEI